MWCEYINSAEKNIVTIIDAPKKPLGPFKPNLILIVIVSGVLGVFLALTIIFLNQIIKNNNTEELKL